MTSLLVLLYQHYQSNQYDSENIRLLFGKRNIRKIGFAAGRHTKKQVHFKTNRETGYFGKMKTCKHCFSTIGFVKTYNGKWKPVNPDGTAHNCSKFRNFLGKDTVVL